MRACVCLSTALHWIHTPLSLTIPLQHLQHHQQQQHVLSLMIFCSEVECGLSMVVDVMYLLPPAIQTHSHSFNRLDFLHTHTQTHKGAHTYWPLIPALGLVSPTDVPASSFPNDLPGYDSRGSVDHEKQDDKSSPALSASGRRQLHLSRRRGNASVVPLAQSGGNPVLKIVPEIWKKKVRRERKVERERKDEEKDGGESRRRRGREVE